MQDQTLISAIRFDGRGAGTDCAEDEIARWTPDQGVLWLHFNYGQPRIHEWLEGRCGLDPVVVEALIAEDARPRSFTDGDRLFVVLRGLNLNPGAELLDMVSVRAWIEPGRIITVRQRKVMAVEDVRQALYGGTGPRDAGTFLVQLCGRLTQRIAMAVSQVEEQEDAAEDLVVQEGSRRLRPVLSDLRRRLINLRRYLAPQRQVISQFQSDQLSWLGAEHKSRLREIADRVTRYVEDLDAARERAAVAQDELESRLAEQLNRNMYVLSVVAAIFLPLSLLTGLLGINVLGIPGADNPYGFYVVCGCLAVIAAAQIWFFRRTHLM